MGYRIHHPPHEQNHICYLVTDEKDKGPVRGNDHGFGDGCFGHDHGSGGGGFGACARVRAADGGHIEGIEFSTER